MHKGEGGISGITSRALAHQNLPDCLLKQRACSASAWQKGPITDFSQSKLDRQERNIQDLKYVIIQNNPFDVDVLENIMRDKLINFANNMVIPQDITENILNAEARGNK